MYVIDKATKMPRKNHKDILVLRW